MTVDALLRMVVKGLTDLDTFLKGPQAVPFLLGAFLKFCLH